MNQPDTGALFAAQLCPPLPLPGRFHFLTPNAVGDAKLQVDGKAEQVDGKVQNAVGGLNDTLKP